MKIFRIERSVDSVALSTVAFKTSTWGTTSMSWIIWRTREQISTNAMFEVAYAWIHQALNSHFPIPSS